MRQHRRSIWSTLHVWWGRIFLTFAIIQGGLGLRFAANTTGGKIAYGIVAGLVWITWFVLAVRHDMERKKQTIERKRVDGMFSSELVDTASGK